MAIPNRKLPDADKFRDFLPMSMLGLGTIWFGRRWPANNKNYKQPSLEEIYTHLDNAYDSGIRMFDTAAAYGYSEERLGSWIRTGKAKNDRLFIATKWGENFNVDTESSVTDHSIENLRRSLHRSMRYLPQIDLLYIHKANETVLNDPQIRKEMSSYIEDGKIKYSGVSISDTDVLNKVVESNDLWFDFLQTSADVLASRPELIEKVFNAGTAIVINSPIRKSEANTSPKEAYLRIVQNPFVSFVLTGTRTHLKETIDYFGL